MIFRIGSTPKQNMAFMQSNKAFMITIIVLTPLILLFFCLGASFMPITDITLHQSGSDVQASVIGGVLFEHMTDSVENTGIWVYSRAVTEDVDAAQNTYDYYVDNGYGDDGDHVYSNTEAPFEDSIRTIGILSKILIAFSFACILVVLLSFLSLIASRNFVLAFKISLNVIVLEMIMCLLSAWYATAFLDKAVNALSMSSTAVVFRSVQVGVLYGVCLAGISAIAVLLSIKKRQFNKRIQQAKMEIIEERQQAQYNASNLNTTNDVFGHADNSSVAADIGAGESLNPFDDSNDENK